MNDYPYGSGYSVLERLRLAALLTPTPAEPTPGTTYCDCTDGWRNAPTRNCPSCGGTGQVKK